MEGMSSSLREVGAEAVTTDVFHLVFVWEGRNRAGRVFSVKRFVKKDKVCEATAHVETGSRKGSEVRLQQL